MMAEFWHNFHFLRPWLLLLLVLPLFLYGFYFRGISVQSSWQKVIDKRLLDYLLVKGSSSKRHFLVLLALIGMLVAIIAAAGPSWQKVEVPLLSQKNPVMVLLNLSSDMTQTDITPSRLVRAKYKIKDFLSMLKGNQAGIIVYSSEPFMISPITEDTNILANLLPAISVDIMPTNGDRLDRAIDFAVSKLQSAGYQQGELVVFSSDVGQKFDQALASAKEAKAKGLQIDVIGMSLSANEKLSMVASSGGGSYWPVQTSDAKIAALAEELSQNKGDLNIGKNMRTMWFDGGYWLIIVPLVCCLLFFRQGILVLVLLVGLSSQANAGFFTNSDQDGLTAFNQGNYAQAASSFEDSNWQAASYYRLGDYQSAFKAYQHDNSVEGLYNQGNALAKLGQINEAISKYEEVLKLNPAHEDAKFNLEYLKKQQNEQNKQNKQKQDNNNNQNNNDNSNQQQNKEDKGHNSQSQQENTQSPSQGDNDSNNQDNQPQASPQDEGKQDQNSDREDKNANQERQSALQDMLDENNSDNQNSNSQGAMSKEGDNKEQYDEKMQAKARQYREIPEDPGGLLKAFIYQEYRQNRYNEP